MSGPAFDPLTSALTPEPTDQWTKLEPGPQPFGAQGRRAASAAHLNNWIDDGNHKMIEGIDLRRDMENPIDPVRDWPPGQMLEGVKLQRARGGCLGAKSR